MNDIYKQKAALPREARNAPDLRSALRAYASKRLLHVSDACLPHVDNVYRKEFGMIHKRYANMLFMVTEAIHDADYLAESILTWMKEDFDNAVTGAQKDAAGLCGAELISILQNQTRK